MAFWDFVKSIAVVAVAFVISGVIGGATFGAQLIKNALLGSFALNSLGFIGAGDQQARKRDIYARTQMVQDPEPSRRIIYGRCRIAPKIISVTQGGHHSIIAVLCDHALNKLHGIEIDEQKFFTDSEFASLSNSEYVEISANVGDGQGALRKRINDAYKSLKQNSLIKTGIVPSTGSYFPYYFRYGGPMVMSTSIQDISRPAHEKARTQNAFQGSFLRWLTSGRGRRGSNANQMETPGGAMSLDQSFRLTGMAWMYIGLIRADKLQLEWQRDPNAQPVWSGIPNVVLDVSRNNNSLIRPRTDPSDPSTEVDGGDYIQGNAALALFDYMSRYTEYAEAMFDGEHPRLDHASALEAAKACDDNNWTANGAIDLTTPPTEVISQLCLCMNGGDVTERAGMRYFHAGVTSPITQTITDDDIQLGSYGGTLGSPIANRATSMDLSYIDVKGDLQSTRVRRDEAVSHMDTQELTLSLINNEEQASQVGRIIMTKLWDGENATFDLANPLKVPRASDRIRIKLDKVGVDEEFRVLEVTATAEGRFSIAGISEAADLYDKKNSTTYKPPQKPVTPPPTTAPPPTPVTPGPVTPPPPAPPPAADADYLLIRPAQRLKINSTDLLKLT